MSSRKKHVFPLNNLKQGIETFESLSFDLFKLSLEILTLIKYGVIMTKSLYFNYKRNRFLLHLLVDTNTGTMEPP